MWASVQPLSRAEHEQEVWEGKREGSFHYNKMSCCNISQVLWLQFLQAHLKLQKQLKRHGCVEGGLVPPMGANPRHNHWLSTHPTAAPCAPPRVGKGGRKRQGSSKGHSSLHHSFWDLVNLWRAEGGEEEEIFILQPTKEVTKVWWCQPLAACHRNTGAASPFLLKPGCSLCWAGSRNHTSQTPLPPATAGWHRAGGLVGDVSAGRCWSVDTGWVRLNEMLLWAGKTPKKEKWRCLPPQSVCLPLVFSYFPVLSKHTYCQTSKKW